MLYMPDPAEGTIAMCSSVPNPEAVDNTPFPPEKFRIGSFGRSNVSVVQLLAVTERVGLGVEPETFVTPAHSIPPLVPPSVPIVPLATTASRHPTATWTALSA